MDGIAAVGTETAFARGDHRHPSDTSKANVADVYTKTEVDTELAKKANVTDVYTKQEIDTKFEESTSDIEDMELVISSSLNDLNSRIIANKDRLDSVDTTLETVNTGMESMFNGVEYVSDSNSHKILFKNGTTTVKELDADAFIKDGMVSNVEISNGNLVITFNTDSGKEPISIPLTDIFNPANYYTKSDVDTELDKKADASSVYTKTETDGLLNGKANSADVYNKTEVDNALGSKADASDSYTKSEIDEALALKADANSVYTKSEIDNMELTVSSSLNDLNTRILNNNGRLDGIDASITSINTKDSEQDTAIALKANTADMTTALAAKANTTDMETALALKANSADVYTKTAANDLFATKTELGNLTGDIEDMELVIASSLNDLNTRVIANGNAISSNSDALETINTTLANIQSALTELTTRVGTLETNLEALTGRVEALERN
jgi:prefoldin subunit 5